MKAPWERCEECENGGGFFILPNDQPDELTRLRAQVAALTLERDRLLESNRMEVDEFNAGFAAYVRGVAYYDLPDGACDVIGTGWAWAFLEQGRKAVKQLETAEAQRDEAQQACVKSAANLTFILGKDIPETIERARLALVQRCERVEAQNAALASALERIHGLIELLGGRFKGYLPWPDDKRDSVVRGHEMFIEDTIKKADALSARRQG